MKYSVYICFLVIMAALSGNTVSRESVKRDAAAENVESGENIINKSPLTEGENTGAAENPFEAPVTVTDFEGWRSTLLSAIYNLEPEAALYIKGYDSEVYDFSRLCFNEATVNVSSRIQNDRATVLYTFDYKDSFKILTAIKNHDALSKLNDEEKAVIEFFRQEADRITDENMTDFEKELAVHDYIVGNYSYADDKDIQNDEYYNVKYFIKNKVGFCEAYAYSFASMAELCGVEAVVMFGESGGSNHAWNAVKLDGEYYHVDTTFDDGADQYNIVLHGYFNLNDDEMAKTHIWTKDDNNGITASGTKYNYYTYKNSFFESKARLQNYIANMIESNETNIEFKINGFNMSKEELKELLLQYSDKISRYSIIGSFEGDGPIILIINYR